MNREEALKLLDCMIELQHNIITEIITEHAWNDKARVEWVGQSENLSKLKKYVRKNLK